MVITRSRRHYDSDSDCSDDDSYRSRKKADSDSDCSDDDSYRPRKKAGHREADSDSDCSDDDLDSPRKKADHREDDSDSDCSDDDLDSDICTTVIRTPQEYFYLRKEEVIGFIIQDPPSFSVSRVCETIGESYPMTKYHVLRKTGADVVRCRETYHQWYSEMSSLLEPLSYEPATERTGISSESLNSSDSTIDETGKSSEDSMKDLAKLVIDVYLKTIYVFQYSENELGTLLKKMLVANNPEHLDLSNHVKRFYEGLVSEAVDRRKSLPEYAKDELDKIERDHVINSRDLIRPLFETVSMVSIDIPAAEEDIETVIDKMWSLVQEKGIRLTKSEKVSKLYEIHQLLGTGKNDERLLQLGQELGIDLDLIYSMIYEGALSMSYLEKFVRRELLEDAKYCLWSLSKTYTYSEPLEDTSCEPILLDEKYLPDHLRHYCQEKPYDYSYVDTMSKRSKYDDGARKPKMAYIMIDPRLQAKCIPSGRYSIIITKYPPSSKDLHQTQEIFSEPIDVVSHTFLLALSGFARIINDVCVECTKVRRRASDCKKLRHRTPIQYSKHRYSIRDEPMCEEHQYATRSDNFIWPEEHIYDLNELTLRYSKEFLAYIMRKQKLRDNIGYWEHWLLQYVSHDYIHLVLDKVLYVLQQKHSIRLTGPENHYSRPYCHWLGINPMIDEYLNVNVFKLIRKGSFLRMLKDRSPEIWQMELRKMSEFALSNIIKKHIINVQPKKGIQSESDSDYEDNE